MTPASSAALSAARFLSGGGVLGAGGGVGGGGAAAKKRALLRIVAINDVYRLTNLPKLSTYLSSLVPPADAVVLAGDFVSPSTLSSIDAGRGMVSTLRSAGVTHACLGNHEADLKLPVLRRRVEELSKSATVINTNVRRTAPAEGGSSDARWLEDEGLVPSRSIVTTKCDGARVALLGLMSDEEGIFRDGKFKGVPVDDVKEAVSSMHRSVVGPDGGGGEADIVLPLTHQSVGADRELARHMIDRLGYRRGIIVGGHDHHVIDETVGSGPEDDGDDVGDGAYVRIVKSGSDAENAALIDLEFDPSTDPSTLEEVSVTLTDLTSLPDSPIVRKIADAHMSVVDRMEREIIVDSSVVPPDVILCSKRTRYEQTTMGGFFCQAIKEEMEADVALMNGSSIKGNDTYADGRMSFAQLRRELPFPTKIVVVNMTRGELLDAIEYSRTHVAVGGKDGGGGGEGGGGEREGGAAMKGGMAEGEEVPRKGYLQTDFDHAASDWCFSKDGDEVLQVALPRNLLSGFCNIRPLVDVGQRLREAGQFPSADDFIPAIDLIVRHCCKTRWMEIASSGDFAFEDWDRNSDGVLDGEEIKILMQSELGYTPEDDEVERMIASIDADGDGNIDAGELSYLLATMERQRGF